jgi:hypothetical protein
VGVGTVTEVEPSGVVTPTELEPEPVTTDADVPPAETWVEAVPLVPTLAPAETVVEPVPVPTWTPAPPVPPLADTDVPPAFAETVAPGEAPVDRPAPTVTEVDFVEMPAPRPVDDPPFVMPTVTVPPPSVVLPPTVVVVPLPSVPPPVGIVAPPPPVVPPTVGPEPPEDEEEDEPSSFVPFVEAAVPVRSVTPAGLAEDPVVRAPPVPPETTGVTGCEAVVGAWPLSGLATPETAPEAGLAAVPTVVEPSGVVGVTACRRPGDGAFVPVVAARTPVARAAVAAPLPVPAPTVTGPVSPLGMCGVPPRSPLEKID